MRFGDSREVSEILKTEGEIMTDFLIIGGYLLQLGLVEVGTLIGDIS